MEQSDRQQAKFMVFAVVVQAMIGTSAYPQHDVGHSLLRDNT